MLFDDDGVISIRSEHPVNRRYAYAAPGESERVFAPDGIVRTGDLGYLDEDGFLFILGRADDVIVLDNGKKVIVRPIEEYLKASPAIEECVVFCPTQTHLVAVVSPAAEPADEPAIAAHGWPRPTPRSAATSRSGTSSSPARAIQRRQRHAHLAVQAAAAADPRPPTERRSNWQRYRAP